MSPDTPVAGALPKPAGVFKKLLWEAAFWGPVPVLVWLLPQADPVDQAFFVSYIALALGIRFWRGSMLHHWPWLVLHGAIACTLLGELDKLQGYNSDLGDDFALPLAQGLLWMATLAVLVARIGDPKQWMAGFLAVLVLAGAVLSAPMQLARQLWYQAMDHSKPCVYATKITPDTVYGLAFSSKSKVVWFSREEGTQAEESSIDVVGLGGGTMEAQVANVNTPVFGIARRLFCKT